jgi:chemotaxis protein CheD
MAATMTYPEAPGAPEPPLPLVYLHPGHVFVSAAPTAVSTILGSCVAVCLYDPGRGIGGVNHYLLPHWAGAGCSSARFGNVAIRELVEGVLALGGVRERLEAKVFGGACVLEAFSQREVHLGDQNVGRAFDCLAQEGVTIASQATGGRRGRKLVFHTGDGSAWIKEI